TSTIVFFQAEDGIRDRNVTGVQTCALPISGNPEELFRVESGSGTEDGEFGDFLGGGHKWSVEALGLAPDVVVVRPVDFFAPSVGGDDEFFGPEAECFWRNAIGQTIEAEHPVDR